MVDYIGGFQLVTPVKIGQSMVLPTRNFSSLSTPYRYRGARRIATPRLNPREGQKGPVRDV